MLLLTDDEVAALTGRQRRPAQKRELRALGIPFRERTDGTIVVLRRDVEGPQPMSLTIERPKVRAPA